MLDVLDVPKAVQYTNACRNFDGSYGCAPGVCMGYAVYWVGCECNYSILHNTIIIMIITSLPPLTCTTFFPHHHTLPSHYTPP